MYILLDYFSCYLIIPFPGKNGRGTPAVIYSLGMTTA